MSNVNIEMMRIDQRLIHGQGQMWLNALGVNTVIVANDDASEDKIQQTLMKTVVSKSIAMRFFSIEHTCEIIHKASPKQKIFLVCQTPEDALKLVAGGVPVKEINIGNIHNAEGKQQVTRSIYLGKEDKEALKELSQKYGVKFNTKTTPSGNDGALQVDITKYLD
ncbi:PTS sugar transporter subunit IIB [Clostridium chauvoei]|uniref:PTS system mannose/fructose/N-acetylgalactosamine-transporter subunit IIB n=2 Tax=Clostridium chauvoei TaxID=46867 RepID=A0ABD4RG58_9CLOT|nr:PTS system mannose/fructose/N-acetylgalactosamine-transporter subunit IIB [Clostridium chauvoei]ATD55790.1 PTS N-acetylgalactosamine transporter subunit IIB [Clostridium chauvoei]MBX7280336.1 PTS system mannose/fructose/N-acetylgalactosamine-transporter subunit IIB [Clostridium chauvoei]MBX7282821.1 PTS system mannose/fructose/N-acetylgalactosamine-transporter subunit IIB [Clostridium chauvoei]MBX7285227.1 PTS system mannose/fructose/N-acetylgalactosamine-transporter subunit IIB [Clostridium